MFGIINITKIFFLENSVLYVNTSVMLVARIHTSAHTYNRKVFVAK